MAATANVITNKSAGCRREQPAAAVRHYEGAFAFTDATGFAAAVVASGVNRFAGIVAKECDNSAGSAGDKKVELEKDGCWDLVGSGFTQADVDKLVYASDSNTITLTGSATVVLIGRVEKYISTTKLSVRIFTEYIPRAAALTAADATTLNTGHAPSDTVIGNMRNRIAEIEAILQKAGMVL